MENNKREVLRKTNPFPIFIISFFRGHSGFVLGRLVWFFIFPTHRHICCCLFCAILALT